MHPIFNIFRHSLLVVLFFQTAIIQAATIESAQTGNWNATATWAGGVIPAAGDDVVVKNGHTVTLSDTRPCVTLTVESGATLTLTGALNNSGVFLNQGTVDWSGTLTGAGNFTNDGILNISGGGNHNTAAHITNNAGKTVNWNSGNLDASGGGQILTNNGMFNLIGNNPSNLTCSMPIVNTGTVNKTTGTLTIVQTFDNQATGTVNVAVGATLSFGTSNNLTQSGAFIVDGALSLGSNLTQTQVFTINGTANVGNLLTFGAGAGFSGTGTVNITGSASTFNAGSTLTTKLTITGGTLNDNVGLTPGEVTFNGVLGVYSGTGSPTFANGFIWNAGSFSGSGTVTISGGMSVNNASGHSILGDKQLHLSGTGTVNNGALLSFSGTAKFIVTSTGAVTFDGASNASASGGANNLFEIQSGGALIKSGAGMYSLQLPFSENGGSITVDGGTLRFGPSTQSFTNGTVVLNASTSLIFNSSTATMTGTAVSGAGTLRLEVSTLHANAGTTVTSKIHVFTGTLNDNVGLQPGEVTLGSVAQGFYGGTGNPTFANGFIWNLGDIQGSGIITVSGSLAATNTGTGTIRNTKELHITGIANFTGSGFAMLDNARFIVKPGGSVILHVTGSTESVGGGVNTLFELESGSVLTKTGAGTFSIGVPFKTTDAAVNVDAGTLSVGVGSTHNLSGGTITVTASSIMALSSGVFNLTGISISGAGTFQISSSGANVTINTGTSVSTKLHISAGILHDNVGLTPGEVTLGSNAFNHGIYAGTGSPTFSNGFNWIHGTFQGSGIVTVNSTMTAANSNLHAVANTKELRIAGAATFDAGGGLTLSSTAKTTVTSTGAATFQGASAMSLNGTSATLFDIQSGGTLSKTNTGNLVASTAFSNAGTVSIETGTLNLNSTFTNTGTIKGTGTLDLGTTNTNTGTFAPGLSPGMLGVVGNYVNSTLDIEIDAGPPVAKDLLNVTGNITLTGSTLNVSEVQCLPNGSYDIISYTGTRTGSFATVNAPAAYSVSYDDAAKKVRLDYLDGVPTIVCPDNVSVNTDAGVCTAGGVALGTPTGTDNCAGVIYSNDAGTFPIAASTVIWTATDVIGQTATCEQTVTVSDAEPPVITCPADQTVTVNAVCSGLLGTWTPISVSDNCAVPEAITVTQSPDATTTLYGPGATETVTLTADDGNGNTDDCSFTVTLNITALPAETCNGIDDDCDGLIDDNDPNVTGQPTWYADADGDGFGDAAIYQLACNQPAGYVSNDADCDDANAAVNPAGAEICNGIDDDCDGLTDDADPGVTGQPIWYADADGDGFGDAAVSQLVCNQPAGFVSNDGDCDDANAAVNPAAAEICNGIDDDCDSLIDDADPSVTGQPIWYADADGDGFGDAAVSQLACNQPAGYVSNDGDCNDGDWFINPTAEEVCNGMDDDCDGLIDDDDPSVDGQITWYADADGDGYGTPANYQVSCDQPAGFVANNNDCDDTDAGINPGMPEVCNGIDDDCDGLTDEGCGNPLTVDAGTCQVVYHGYAPLSCTTLNASAAGGTSPYAFVWSNGMTGASIQVCPTAGQSYTVTVTDNMGNTAFDGVTVEVVDVRCGNNNNKVLLCHNGSNTLCISPNAVPDHLGHGDYLGTCGSEPCSGENNGSKPGNTTSATLSALPAVRMMCYPNPIETEINILITGGTAEEGIFNIVDASGRLVVHFKTRVLPDEPVRMELAGLSAGVYSLLWKTQGRVLATRFIVAKR